MIWFLYSFICLWPPTPYIISTINFIHRHYQKILYQIRCVSSKWPELGTPSSVIFCGKGHVHFVYTAADMSVGTQFLFINWAIVKSLPNWRKNVFKMKIATKLISSLNPYLSLREAFTKLWTFSVQGGGDSTPFYSFLGCLSQYCSSCSWMRISHKFRTYPLSDQHQNWVFS